MSVIVKLLSKFDDSGIKKAQHGFGGLKKTLGALGVGLSLAQIGNVLLDATKAASADAKSTKLLNIQLTRNAGATKESLKQNDKFIESLSLQTGIMDDDLRPSMAKFGNVTKNVKDAQKLLKITLDGAAGSGKNQEKIANAVAKAYAGNTTSLKKMFPELMKSKDVLADFAKTYEGLAVANADPFMKFNNSMDILKEKLGNLILPAMTSFIDFLTKPGGVIESVSKFFDDIGNPKTDVGKYFQENVMPIFSELKDIFTDIGITYKKIFEGNGGKVFIAQLTLTLKILEGILWTFDEIIKILGEISTGKIVSKNASSNSVDAGVLSFTGGKALTNTGKFKATGDVFSFGGISDTNAITPKSGSTINNITINATSADPKATVDAVSKYVKQNGALPSTWNAYGTKP